MVTTSTKKPAIPHGLGIFLFDGKAAILILNVVSRSDNIVSNFKKVSLVSTMRTSKTVNDIRFRKHHTEKYTKLISSFFRTSVANQLPAL